MHDFILVKTNEEYASAAALFNEYATWLGIDLSFQRFEEELIQIKSMYAAPLGGIILCKIMDEYVGCVAIREQEYEVAELKRMYVKPGAQNKGIGNALLQEAILLAKKYMYKKIRLDTLSDMAPAIKLYRKSGFYSIPAYYFNPQKRAVYFEKSL